MQALATCLCAARQRAESMIDTNETVRWPLSDPWNAETSAAPTMRQPPNSCAYHGLRTLR